MSQEKIDARKKNKGDMLHKAKKSYRIVTITVATILVALGALFSVYFYHTGYTKGEAAGEKTGMALYQMLYGSGSQQETTTANEEATTASQETTTANEETTASK